MTLGLVVVVVVFSWWDSGPACPNPLGQQAGVYSMIADTTALHP